MHGREDGTVPATFQTIYMVYAIITVPKQRPDVKDADRVEAFPRPTKASQEGIRHEKPQGCSLSLVWQVPVLVPSFVTKRCSRILLPWFLRNHLGSCSFIIPWPLEFSLWHHIVKCILPTPRLVPMKKDLNNLVDGQHLPCREFCEISPYWKTSVTDTGLHCFLET